MALPLQDGCWSSEQLEQMAAARSAAWRKQCQLGRVPVCLQQLLAYARSLSPVCQPDYSIVSHFARGLAASVRQPEE